MRTDVHIRPAGSADGAPEELNLHACRRGKARVERRDAGDAAHGHPLRRDLPPVGDVRQNARLAPGVDALHVGGGVCLGIAEPLRLRERVCVLCAVFEHLREDIIRCAVEDARHIVHDVRVQTFVERMEHRDAAADRRLKQELAAVALRKRDELRAVLGDELLVGGHDVLAAPQRAGADVQRDAAAADGLHHELRRVVLFDGGKIPHHVALKRVSGEVPAH